VSDESIDYRYAAGNEKARSGGAGAGWMSMA
jgi:hypothetical protein